MIPNELADRFSTQTVFAVRRGDFMFAFGFPCQVVSLGYVKRGPKWGIDIQCRDIFNHVVHIVHLKKQCSPLVTFVPEHIDHIALFIDGNDVLTDREDIITTRQAVVPGNILQMLSAPVCMRGQWGVNRRVEKIIEGPEITPDEAYTYNTRVE